MASDVIIQTFTKGMSGDASPYVLDLSQCATVKNMLFERGLLISRPGVTSIVSSSPNSDQYVRAYMPHYSSLIGVPIGIVVSQAGVVGAVTLSLVSMSDTAGLLLNSLGYSAGPALTMLSPADISVAPFNDVFMLGGFQQGLVRLTTAAVHTIPTAVSYRYVTTHLSRIIAAASGTTATTLRTIGWSKIGDETVWTGDYTAGSVVLQEADDWIAGLSVLRNVVVVARAHGFHLGSATGNAANPYDWKCWSKNHIGVGYPRSLATDGDKLFFVSDCDVHTFDLSTITDIGEGITEELFGYAKTYGMQIRGFVTRTYKRGRRPQYHLMPSWTPSTLGAGTIPPLPHFIYDILEGHWSRHTYDFAIGDTHLLDAFPLNYFGLSSSAYTLMNIPQHAPCIVRPSATHFTYNYWNPAVTCEAIQSFTTGRIQIQNPNADFTALRVMLVGQFSDTQPIPMTVAAHLGGSGGQLKAVSVSPPVANIMVRMYYDLLVPGQFFSIVVNIPAGVRAQIRQLVIEHDVSPQEVRT